MDETQRRTAGRQAMSLFDTFEEGHDAREEHDDEGETVTAVFGNVYEFFEWFRHFYKRRVGTPTCKWRDDWWDCPEAEYRLTALWRSWEKARYDPSDGIAVWWRDYADPTMSALMSPAGPFAESHTSGAPDQPLPSQVPPNGRFRDERED